jgi:hypothetical protein
MADRCESQLIPAPPLGAAADVRKNWFCNRYLC